MNRTVRLQIYGRVQGVWYRAWAKEKARGLGLSGWARNCDDGTVEVVISGEAEPVGQMIAKCQDGPTHAKVDGVEVSDYADAVSVGFETLPSV